jgi:hypothetical protein
MHQSVYMIEFLQMMKELGQFPHCTATNKEWSQAVSAMTLLSDVFVSEVT